MNENRRQFHLVKKYKLVVNSHFSECSSLHKRRYTNEVKPYYIYYTDKPEHIA